MLESVLLLTCQAPVVALASTSSDSSLAGDPVVLDEDWIRREEGAPGAARYVNQRAQMALLGDLDADGVFDAPSDVDALAYAARPGAPGPMAFDVLFSLLAGIGTYEDGDLLRVLENGGVQVEVGEAEFVAALQPGSGGFDLDAAEWMAPNEIWFSTEGTLLGTVLGDVEDGDVLVLDRNTGSVRRAYSEVQMQAFVDAAAPGSGAIGDVLSLAFYPPTGELAFTVQSPSGADASVFGTGGGGRVLPGWAEGDWAFQQETELDALSFVSGLPPAPCLDTDVAFYAPGAPVQFNVRHGAPGDIVVTYVSGSIRYLARPGEGAGFFFLDRADRFLNRQVRHQNLRARPFDASGNASLLWPAPTPKAAAAFLDLYFQSYDTGAGAWSAPIVIRIQ
ncbi:MAG: hypothetical protein EYC70_04570 [Planctomycetota bacterium]|nr:MAG: hypothetical protein EYC70_04570 [Planctomycetota bacterium]